MDCLIYNLIIESCHFSKLTVLMISILCDKGMIVGLIWFEDDLMFETKYGLGSGIIYNDIMDCVQGIKHKDSLPCKYNTRDKWQQTEHHFIVGFSLLVLWCLTPLPTDFSYIVVVSFIGGGNRSTQRKPPICRKSLTNFIT